MDVVAEASRALRHVPDGFSLSGPGERMWLATDPVVPHEITPSDLLVVTTAGYGLSPRQVQALLEPGTDRRLVQDALGHPSLDIDLDLIVAGSATIDAMETLHHALRVLLATADHDAIGSATSAAACALSVRKRPDLFVRCGPGLLRVLGLPGRRTAPVAVWGAVRSCLRDDGVRRRVDDLADRLAAAGDGVWTMHRLALLDRVLEEYGAARGSVGGPVYGAEP